MYNIPVNKEFSMGLLMQRQKADIRQLIEIPGTLRMERKMRKNYKYIFVHGLAGWGSYDKAYQEKPYWGMSGGDLMVFLHEKGFDCYAASVAPSGSAWDRACELYAQLAGTRVDYGAAHSRKYLHERFGRDFSSCPLIPTLDQDTRLILIGHSFGGATIRLFSQFMAYGDKDECEATDADDVSALFTGNKGSIIHSVIAIASPMNGTTAYDMNDDPDFDPKKMKAPLWSKVLARSMAKRLKTDKDDRDPSDYADYDMHIDHALELNDRIKPIPSVYYFSVPCSGTRKQKDGTQKPKRQMEPVFVMRSSYMGAYTGKTRDGFITDESWQENDGLVNTISAKFPIGAPAKPLDKEKIVPGLWNVFPTFDGDHMALQGGLMRKHDIRDFYLELLDMIEAL